MSFSEYPFTPKSAIKLIPGQFWGVPLKDGSFACGRVIQAAANYAGASKMYFYAALLDWRGFGLPTFETIAGARCIEQGKLHVKSLKTFGTDILGTRPLEFDNLSPIIVNSGLGDPPDQVMLGLEPLRKIKSSDSELPLQSLWGYGYIRGLAEHKFLNES